MQIIVAAISAQINAQLKDVIDAPTEEPWGIRVERVEVKDVSVKDVSLPESCRCSDRHQRLP